MSTSTISVIEGERKFLAFTVTDEDGSPVDLSSGVILALAVKNSSGVLFSKAHGDFDTEQAASGIVRVLSEAFSPAGKYKGVLAMEFSSGVIAKKLFGIDVKDG